MSEYKRIIAVVGMCGSGKSEATNYFCSAGWDKVYFGGLTMDILAEKGLEKNEENERTVRENLRKEHGPAAFAKLLLPKIALLAQKNNTVLDGLYSWSEYKILRDHFGESLEVLAIVTPRNIRYSRLGIRKIRPLTKEDCRKRDYSEIENIEKGGPIAIADSYAENSGNLERLYEQLDKIIAH